MIKRKTRRLKNRQGQAVLESLISLPIAGACLILGLLLFWAYAQQMWMDHQLYQSLICMAKGEPKAKCEQTLKKKIKLFLWAGELKNLRLIKKQTKWWGGFTWKTPFWTIPFKQVLRRSALL